VNVKKAAPAILPQTVAREEKMNDGQKADETMKKETMGRRSKGRSTRTGGDK
jgi:hypothetical protein